VLLLNECLFLLFRYRLSPYTFGYILVSEFVRKIVATQSMDRIFVKHQIFINSLIICLMDLHAEQQIDMATYMEDLLNVLLSRVFLHNGFCGPA